MIRCEWIELEGIWQCQHCEWKIPQVLLEVEEDRPPKIFRACDARGEAKKKAALRQLPKKRPCNCGGRKKKV